MHAAPDNELQAVATLLKSAGRTIETNVIGGSMAPTIPNGALLRIACGNVKAPPTGTVIVFRKAERLVAHRVVGAGWTKAVRHLLITQGDSNVLCDNPITREDVLGVVMEWRLNGAWQPVSQRPYAGPLRRIAAAVSRLTILVSLSLGSRASRLTGKLLTRAANIGGPVLRRLGRRP